MSMELAYDDFGAWQARLDELTEVPPDFLKFDMKLIRDIDQAHAVRRNLVESLVRWFGNGAWRRSPKASKPKPNPNRPAPASLIV